MNYYRRVLKRRSACLTDQEWLAVIERGKLPRPDRLYTNAQIPGRVIVTRVLCWWCREYHHPDEVEKCMVLPRKTASVEGSQSSTSSALAAGPLKQLHS